MLSTEWPNEWCGNGESGWIKQRKKERERARIQIQIQCIINKYFTCVAFDLNWLCLFCNDQSFLKCVSISRCVCVCVFFFFSHWVSVLLVFFGQLSLCLFICVFAYFAMNWSSSSSSFNGFIRQFVFLSLIHFISHFTFHSHPFCLTNLLFHILPCMAFWTFNCRQFRYYGNSVEFLFAIVNGFHCCVCLIARCCCSPVRCWIGQ